MLARLKESSQSEGNSADRLPVHERGVSLAFLRDLGACVADPATLTPGQLVFGSNTVGPHNWKDFDPLSDPTSIAALTQAGRLSLVETCINAGITHSEQGAAFFGPSTVFVSYGWHGGTVVTEQIDAVALSESRTASTEPAFYWLDVLSVAQNQATPEQRANNAADVAGFGAVVQHTHSTLLYLCPSSHPVPLTRVWCLYEIMMTLSEKHAIQVAFRQPDYEALRLCPPQDLRVMLDSLDSVSAGATFVGDWCRIHMHIELLLNPESEWEHPYTWEVETPELDESGFYMAEYHGVNFMFGEFDTERQCGTWAGDSTGHLELNRVVRNAVTEALTAELEVFIPAPLAPVLVRECSEDNHGPTGDIHCHQASGVLCFTGDPEETDREYKGCFFGLDEPYAFRGSVATESIHWVAGTRGMVITAALGSSVLRLLDASSLTGPSGDMYDLLVTSLVEGREERAVWERSDAVVAAMASLGDDTVAVIHRNGSISVWEFSFKKRTTTDRTLHATVVSTERVTNHILLCVTKAGVVDTTVEEVGRREEEGSDDGSWETVEDDEEEDGNEEEQQGSDGEEDAEEAHPANGFSITVLDRMNFLLGSAGEDTASWWRFDESERELVPEGSVLVPGLGEASHDEQSNTSGIRYLGRNRLAVPRKDSIDVYQLKPGSEEVTPVVTLLLRDVMGTVSCPEQGMLAAWTTSDRGVRIYMGDEMGLLHVLPHRDMILGAAAYVSAAVDGAVGAGTTLVTSDQWGRVSWWSLPVAC